MQFKPTDWLLATATLCLFVSILLAVFIFSSNWTPTTPNAKPAICFENGACLEVELAHSVAERERGLMFRERLPENAGMLFLFGSDEIHSFWMKNTLIPLDMIWLDADGRIIGFQENVPPCMEALCPLFSIARPSRMVLETNAGFVETNSVHIGQKVSLILPQTKE